MDDLGQEVLGPFILGVLKDLLGRSLLGDHAAVHKEDAGPHLLGEAISWVTTTMVTPSFARS